MADHLGAKLNRQVNQMLAMPPELTWDMPKVTMVGNLQVHIDNHKGIRTYQAQQIEVNCRGGRLLIRGKELLLKNISLEALLINGVIDQIEYIDETL